MICRKVIKMRMLVGDRCVDVLVPSVNFEDTVQRQSLCTLE
jgi:hypothetical protein